MGDAFWATLCNVRDWVWHALGLNCPGHLYRCPDWSAQLTCPDCELTISATSIELLAYRAALHTKTKHPETYKAHQSDFDEMLELNPHV